MIKFKIMALVHQKPFIPPIGGPSERSVKHPVPLTPKEYDKYAIKQRVVKDENQGMFACCAVQRSKADNPHGARAPR